MHYQLTMSKSLVFLLLLSFAAFSHALPLSTNSRWIVDDTSGDRVKLKCINWAAHLEPMLPEGLYKQPVNDIAKHISAMGFNCVRLTWAVHMYTRFANLTVAQSLLGLGLDEAIVGVARYNPQFLDMTLVDAQKAAIDALGNNGVMTLLDCQVSKPQWCCDNNDGNGFFGDQYFDPNEWVDGLSMVAKRYKDTPMVMAMSLRNELRGPGQNATVWRQWMPRGAQAIHKANPNVLILVSGFNYDLDFTFLKEKPVNFNVPGKIVYEAHRYSWSNGDQDCETMIKEVENNTGFLLEGNNPLLYSEFGTNTHDNDNKKVEEEFIGCLMGYLAEKDLDWSFWCLQGTYYLWKGVYSLADPFGMLNPDWTALAKPSYHQRLQLMQQTLQDPKSNGPSYYVLNHLGSSKCMKADGSNVVAGDCLGFSKWNHGGNGTPIKLKGTDLCISAPGEELPVTLTTDCLSEKSQWEFVSDYKMELRNKEGLCLDMNLDYSSKVMAKKCLCESDGTTTTCADGGHSQWFKLITANVY